MSNQLLTNMNENIPGNPLTPPTQNQTNKEKEDSQPERIYYEILEVNPGAPFAEIKSSFLHLKKLYSSESPVLIPVMEEISKEKQSQLLSRIEDAYNHLKDYFSTKDVEKQKITYEQVSKKNIPEFEIYSGNALKLTREVLGVEIQEISLATGIPVKHLQNLEMERFDRLPPEGYIRIYVTRYAEYLSLDPQRVTLDYMKVFHKKKGPNDINRF